MLNESDDLEGWTFYMNCKYTIKRMENGYIMALSLFISTVQITRMVVINGFVLVKLDSRQQCTMETRA